MISFIQTINQEQSKKAFHDLYASNNVESLMVNIHYKKLKKGTMLSATNDKPLIIVGGHALTCIGTLNVINSMKQLTAAIS